MELFVLGLNQPEKVCDNGDIDLEIYKWPGVYCNNARDIEGLLWHERDLSGSVQLQYHPVSLKHVCISGNKLAGTINLPDLPL